jgi:hypothetical protein
MKILIAVDPAKRLPDPITIIDGDLEIRASKHVFVKYVNKNIAQDFSADTIAYYSHSHKLWYDKIYPLENIFENRNNVVTEWYEEVELESFFPNDDKKYDLASQACNGSSYKISIHQEGQDCFKRQLLKNLAK